MPRIPLKHLTFVYETLVLRGLFAKKDPQYVLLYRYRNLLDQISPHFEKGGKLEKFAPVFEATDTILFSTDERTESGCLKGSGYYRPKYSMWYFCFRTNETLGCR